MRKLYLTILIFCLLAIQPSTAVTGIGLKFSRSGTDAASVTVSVVDEGGVVIEGATATVARSNGNTIETGNVKSGVYIVRVTTENGYKNIKRYINGL